jgi:uncharacterized protein (DUF305 family)
MNPSTRASTHRLVLTLVAAWIVTSTAACGRAPGDDSAEAGFARDMATHHAQAVEMGFLLRDATRDERLRTLAADIIVTQSAQRGMFMGWLQEWKLPQAAPGPRMAWMDAGGLVAPTPEHDMSGAHTMPGMPPMLLMPGMASDAELDTLRRANGRDAEVLFLQLMIRHHEGGVLMARALLAQSRRDDVVTLVRGIESSQMGEIKTMAGMLTALDAQPYPSLLR